MRVEVVLVVSVLERTVRQRNAGHTPPQTFRLDKSGWGGAPPGDVNPYMTRSYNYFDKIIF